MCGSCGLCKNQHRWATEEEVMLYFEQLMHCLKILLVSDTVEVG